MDQQNETEKIVNNEKNADDDDDSHSDDDGHSNNLDPRIEQKLEELNQSTERINRLETIFEECNSKYRTILSESTDKLKSLQNKLGKSVQLARPFYDAKYRLKQVQSKCQKAAMNYEMACEAYSEAKERIGIAEKKFASANHEFDATWQEMLNQANLKLMEAEVRKNESKLVHQNSMKDFHEAEVLVRQLMKKLKPSITKSKPYFDENTAFQKRLFAVKEEIENVINEINRSKVQYAATLKQLECISEEIHAKRNNSPLKLAKRTKLSPNPELNLPDLRENGVDDVIDKSLLQIDDDFLSSGNSSCQIDSPLHEGSLSQHRLSEINLIDDASNEDDDDDGCDLSSDHLTQQPESLIIQTEFESLVIDSEPQA